MDFTLPKPVRDTLRWFTLPTNPVDRLRSPLVNRAICYTVSSMFANREAGYRTRQISFGNPTFSLKSSFVPDSGVCK